MSFWKAKEVTGSFFNPETPSLTRPTDRPLSSTIRMAMSATSDPIRANRPRANESSRRARNTSLPSHVYRHHVGNGADTVSGCLLRLV
ncbi:hypothetical protein SAMN04488548_136962 [Gordonia westfalica]|uniref:Uncharacterized protein n=1 Tax=Gordonia westfalica TaxID=158898 RepID=A0A1H2LX86_9ACTN|nr:hypothetical protein SAMN04488548_136962 [Gordonia westfalica]